MRSTIGIATTRASASQKERRSDQTSRAIGSKTISGRKIIHLGVFCLMEGSLEDKSVAFIREDVKSQPQSHLCAPSGLASEQCGQVIIEVIYSPSQRFRMG